jgi:hypothetical protein
MKIKYLLPLLCIGCGFRYDSATHQFMRLDPFYATVDRGGEYCYSLGPTAGSVEVWTDEDMRPDSSDGLSFQEPVCPHKDELEKVFVQAREEAGIMPQELVGVQLVLVTDPVVCREPKKDGKGGFTWQTTPTCTDGHVIMTRRGTWKNEDNWREILKVFPFAHFKGEIGPMRPNEREAHIKDLERVIDAADHPEKQPQ